MILEERYKGKDKTIFMQNLRGVARRLGIRPEWLLAVMWKESRLEPGALNGSTGASGLIQFMPATASGLGTSAEAIRQMDGSEQLHYVEKYLKPYKGRMDSYEDVYLAVFFPAGLGKADSWILHSSALPASVVAASNPAVDLDDDGQITVAEFRRYCYSGFTDAESAELKKKE